MDSATATQVTTKTSAPPPPRGVRSFYFFAALLALCFSPYLFDLVQYSLKESLYSHVPLIPFICGYLIWQEKSNLPTPARGKLLPVLISGSIGVLLLGTFFAVQARQPSFSGNDSLTLTILAFLFLLLSGAFYFLGSRFIKAILFPVCFAFFMAPFPEKVTHGLEIASQHASAEAYSWMMDLSRATYFQDGLVFMLPNLKIQVAQECSGIRSSFVLFLTSLLAGHMFLKTGWKKFLLAAFVFPLGIARNGFRIYLLSMLTAHVDPWFIKSPLHHHGGPLFFVLSLIPFFGLLIYLRKSDERRNPGPTPINSKPSEDLPAAV